MNYRISKNCNTTIRLRSKAISKSTGRRSIGIDIDIPMKGDFVLIHLNAVDVFMLLGQRARCYNNIFKKIFGRKIDADKTTLSSFGVGNYEFLSLNLRQRNCRKKTGECQGRWLAYV